MDTSTFNNGARIDERPIEEKAKDWNQKEVVASSAQVQWVEKPQDQWRKFPIFNQDGSGSCVMQTQCKELGIMRSLKDGNYVHFSVGDGYQRRANKPEGGMGAVDARKIAKDGITLEDLVPSQNMNDAQLDALVVEPYKSQVGAIFSVPNYLEITPGDIESIASTIQATGKGVMVWFYFTYAEWTEKPTIIDSSLDLRAPGTCRHSVTAVDFTMQGNEKCLIIEDSWGPNAAVHGQRVITESFLKARNWYAGYLVNFKFQIPQQSAPVPTPVVQKPKYVFATDLELNMTNGDIKVLQDCLKYDGEFPINADSTGFFGPITQKAVGDYQIKHGVVSASTDPGYGRVGPKTRAVLNAQFT